MSDKLNERKDIFHAKRGVLFSLIFFLILAVIGTVQALTGASGSVMTQVDSGVLGVAGNYGDAEFIQLDTVSNVEMLDSLDIGTCIEGSETKNTVSGVFCNDAYGEYTIHAYTNGSPYIVITYGDRQILVCNAHKAKQTTELYETILSEIPVM